MASDAMQVPSLMQLMVMSKRMSSRNDLCSGVQSRLPDSVDDVLPTDYMIRNYQNLYVSGYDAMPTSYNTLSEAEISTILAGWWGWANVHVRVCVRVCG
jgi:hypothetical protein